MQSHIGPWRPRHALVPYESLHIFRPLVGVGACRSQAEQRALADTQLRRPRRSCPLRALLLGVLRRRWYFGLITETRGTSCQCRRMGGSKRFLHQRMDTLNQDHR